MQKTISNLETGNATTMNSTMKTVDICFRKTQDWHVALEIPSEYNEDEIETLFYEFIHDYDNKLPCKFIYDEVLFEEFDYQGFEKYEE